ncbi:MAG: PSD1 and planctomycete cytochrome C domain-containing protein [Planctomycetaceae bacterium]
MSGGMSFPSWAAENSEKPQKHWAFRKIVRPPVPQVANLKNVRSPIDQFLLKRLEDNGANYRRETTRRNFLRRAKLDLHGLPPTLEEIERFLSDHQPGAHERLIERLLASPQYGEAWGRDWLDLVRFAETAGFNADPHRPLAYKYRDYVIRSFNDNKPYNRFVAEQLAGDELYPADVDALTATAYNRMWPDESNASDVLLARQDALNDLTKNVGEVFLGVSIGCAQCHDHKFDPIPQTDFYRLQAFFVGIVPKDNVPLGSPRELDDYRARLKHWLARTKKLRAELHKLDVLAKTRAAAIKRRKFPPRVLKSIDTAPEDRTAFDWQLTFWSERQIEVKEKQFFAALTKEQGQRYKQLKAEYDKLKKQKPAPPRTVPVMATVELPSGPPKTYLLDGGSHNKPLEELQPGFLSSTLPKPNLPAKISSPRAGTSGRRSTLVRWLFDKSNPLTARVIANRIWQGHFGRGLVSNANDFGTKTPPPTHPELLDWLAAEFMESGWDIKRMHRLIMSSAAYRQETFYRRENEPLPQAAKVDPGNNLYWHFPRRRLTAERIRDSLLAVSGKLTQKMYGPGVKPELPPNFSARHAWKPSTNIADRNRRSIYIYAKRNLPYPLLRAFDLPDMHESCARRAETTIAPQALMLLNSDLVLDAANSFTKRVLQNAESRDDASLISTAYQMAFGRKARAEEIRLAREFIVSQQRLLERETSSKKNNISTRERAFVDFCHALLNSNEFLFVE